MSYLHFAFPLFAYFLGGIPFGLLIGKIFYKTDIRTAGSQNIGATNVTRLCGKTAGIATFLLDALKGAIVILLVRYYLDVPHFVEILIAVGAILGHAFSPYLKLKGGKAVATSFACLLILYPAITINVGLFWVMSMLVFGTVGLASVSSALLLVLSSINIAILSHNFIDTSFLVFLAVLIIYKHIPNIKDIKNKLKGIAQPDS
jgi:glycerol-3-phosphate acyltransferase PlsY